MKITIPKFDHDLNFSHYKVIIVRKRITTSCYNKIVSELPGLSLGYQEGIYNLSNKPVEIASFYDPRQGIGVKKLKGFFIAKTN